MMMKMNMCANANCILSFELDRFLCEVSYPGERLSWKTIKMYFCKKTKNKCVFKALNQIFRFQSEINIILLWNINAHFVSDIN